jgi:hypothetical protein
MMLHSGYMCALVVDMILYRQKRRWKGPHVLMQSVKKIIDCFLITRQTLDLLD